MARRRSCPYRAGALGERTRSWIRSMRVEGRGYRMAHGLEPVLLSTCFAVLAESLWTPEPFASPAERRHVADAIQACQDAETGLFLDPALVRQECPDSGYSWEYLTRQFTFFALGSLDVLGRSATHPLRYTTPYRSPDAICKWLAGRGWTDPWLESNNVMFVLSALLREKADGTSEDPTLAAAFEWLDAHQSPETGYWDLGRGASLREAMAGAFHFYFLYFYAGRSVGHAEQVIDSTLTLQHADGLFAADGGGGACLDLDAVDVLVKFSLITDHRAEDVARALARTYEAVLRNQNADGGFCEAVRPHAPLWRKSWKRRAAELVGLDRLLGCPWQPPPTKETYLTYSGWERMRYAQDESDMWSAWVRPLTLGLIDARYPGRFSDRVAWRFSPGPTLGWHRPARLKAMRAQSKA